MLKRVQYSTGAVLPDGQEAPYLNPSANDVLAVNSLEQIAVVFVADDLLTPVQLATGETVSWDAKLPAALDAPQSALSADLLPLYAGSPVYGATIDTSLATAVGALDGAMEPVALSGQFSRYPAGSPTPARSERFPLYLDNVVSQPGDTPGPSVLTTANIGTGPGTVAAGDDSRFERAGGLSTARDLAAGARGAVDQRIAGKSSSATTRAIFSSSNDSTHAYTRNPALFCADLDLTCISTLTSVGWRITMITPRHGLTAHHIGMPIGTIGYWTDAANNTYARKVLSVTNVTGDMDLVTVGNLDGTANDLPASITPAAVLATSLPAGLASGEGSLIGCPVITHNQNRHLCIATLQNVGVGTPPYEGLGLPTTVPYAPWNRASDTPGAGAPGILNDSSSPYFLLFGGRPVLLGCFGSGAGTAPDPGLNGVVLQAAIGSAYTLNALLLPGASGAGTVAGFVRMGNQPGSIDLSGDDQNGAGGSINTTHGASIDTSNGGGSIDTSNGGGLISTAYGGGSIRTNGSTPPEDFDGVVQGSLYCHQGATGDDPVLYVKGPTAWIGLKAGGSASANVVGLRYSAGAGSTDTAATGAQIAAAAAGATFLFAMGTQSAPGVAFQGASSVGVWLAAPGQGTLVSGGSDLLTWTGSNVRVSAGTALGWSTAQSALSGLSVSFFPSAGGTVRLDGNSAGNGILLLGSVESTSATGGLVLKSPDGTRYRVTVANGGTLSVVAA